MSYPLYPVEDCPSFRALLLTVRAKYGNKTAFADETHCWTYQMLFDAVLRAVDRFSGASGRCIRLTAEHPFLFCTAYFGIVLTGGIAVLCTAGQEEGCIGDETVDDVAVRELLKCCSPAPLPEEGDVTVVCTVARSSGTTAVAKGVMLSQKNLLTDMVGGMRCYEYPQGARYFHVLPYSHLFGIVADLLGPLYSGGTICFSREKLAFFQQIQYFQPTHMNLPPAMADAMARLLERTGSVSLATGGRLRKMMCAGAPLREETRNLLGQYDVGVFAAYGLTECAPCVSMNRDLDARPGSVGMVLPCCAVRIVDGEVVVRGDNVMLGYWQDPEATSRVLRDGWLYTGDLGQLDEDGYLYLEGRRSNLILFEDGTKLSPESVEAMLNRLPGVQECLLQECSVGGRTSAELIVVSDGSAEASMLERQVRVELERCCAPGHIGSVTISGEPLLRNRLGKVERRKEDTRTEMPD